jgi:hypothetical protein
MPDPTPASWADQFRLEPATAASLADALAATPAPTNAQSCTPGVSGDD